jgi:hypothetical protein
MAMVIKHDQNNRSLQVMSKKDSREPHMGHFICSS